MSSEASASSSAAMIKLYSVSTMPQPTEGYVRSFPTVTAVVTSALRNPMSVEILVGLGVLPVLDDPLPDM